MRIFTSKCFNFSEWSNLTPEQAEYLVHVRGPHDMFQYIVRDLATLANITNAAILYDDSFVMKKNHFNEILSQLPVRHLINRLQFEVLGGLPIIIKNINYFFLPEL